MADFRHNLDACSGDDIAAYLDGELDARANARFEAHVTGCAFCAERLREQRMLLCELEFAFGQGPVLPSNFAELVTVRAQADLRGARDWREQWQALRVCVLLALGAVILLGGAWRENVWQPLRKLWQLLAAAADFAGDALYHAGAGFALLSRNIGGYLFFRSAWVSALLAFGVMGALAWLRRLISDYHRTHSAN